VPPSRASDSLRAASNVGENCCVKGCRQFNDHLPYIDPGHWNSQRIIVPMYGGVPQQLNVSAHAAIVREGVKGWIPDPESTVNAVIGNHGAWARERRWLTEYCLQISKRGTRYGNATANATRPRSTSVGPSATYI
jgi:hypothetical protein